MQINASQEAPVTVDGQAIEEVDHFTYLGSSVSKTGGTDENIKARINKAHLAFATLRPARRSKNLSCHTKLRLFSNNFKSVLLYEAKTLRCTKKLDRKLQVSTNTLNGQSASLTKTLTGKEPGRSQSIGREQRSITCQALDWNPQGKQRRGRPCLTWKRTLQAELKTISMTLEEAKRAERWKLVVRALCSRGNNEE